MNRFTISWKIILAHLWPVLILTSVCLFMPFLLSKANIDGFYNAVMITLGGYLLILLPPLFLFISYWRINKGCEFEVDGTHCVYRGREEEIEFSIEDIEQVIQYINPNEAKEQMGFLHWNMFNYNIIKLKDGRKVVITSLLVPHLQIPFGKNLVEVRTTFFPFYWKED